MNAMPPEEHERVEDLLADRVTTGLSESDELELQALLNGTADNELLDMELAAAAAALAALPIEEMATPMPAGLRMRVEATAPSGAWSVAPPAPIDIREHRRGARFGGWGWVAAAAGIMLAAVAWWPQLAGGGSMTPEQLAKIPGTYTTQWAYWGPQEKPEAHPVDWAQGVQGRVVWNSERQQGFMIFTGMQPNDPKLQQYQLWIIDSTQKHPIDGGVFDIAATSTGDVVVPIRPKINVKDVAAFAVTIEKPGGVVVSGQEERVVVAALSNSK